MDLDPFFLTHGIPTLRISGQVYHSVGSIIADPARTPRNMQVFFVDTSFGVDAPFSPEERSIAERLLEEIRSTNAFYAKLRTCLDAHGADLSTIPVFDVKICGDIPQGQTEMAVVFVGDEDSGPQLSRDVLVLSSIGKGVRRIPATNALYDTMAYALLHAHGERGWTIGLRDTDEKTITAKDWALYRMQIRDRNGEPICYDILHHNGLLSQQYWLDQWMKIELERLNYIRFNQRQLRAEVYQGLADAVAAGDTSEAGTYVVLPSTFLGSPRNYCANYADAMAIVAKYGKPDYFITFTANPKWPEILRACPPNCERSLRSDIIARVFKIKLDSFMDDLLKKHTIGVVAAHIAVVEFQKRGLPHCHILLIMEDAYKPRTIEDIDRVVCAEIPDPEKQPRLFEIVTEEMFHGPCGEENPSCPCMNDEGFCKYHYPKAFCNETTTDEDSFPQYRRRSPEEGGRVFEKTMKGGGKFLFDNRWVVPYSPFFSLKENCHVNFEVCNTLSGVKYVYSYVYKGPDRAAITLCPTVDNQEATKVGGGPHIDEINRYVSSRYCGCCEAVWRINGFPIHYRSPSVVRLDVHQENFQRILYQPGSENVALQDPLSTRTKLTAYFERCLQEAETPLTAEERGYEEDGVTLLPDATSLTYPEFPLYYTWNDKTRTWHRRKRPHKSTCIGRMYTVHPKAGEKFFLRLLLNKVKGATSFADLRKESVTYQDACIAMGLFATDDEWRETMAAAALAETNVVALRSLFATILYYNRPAKPWELWQEFKTDLSSDYTHERAIAMRNTRSIHVDDSDINEALCDINDMILELSCGAETADAIPYCLPYDPHYQRRGKETSALTSTGKQYKCYILSTIIHSYKNSHLSYLGNAFNDEYHYDVAEQLATFTRLHESLNSEQRPLFDHIRGKIDRQDSGLHMVHAAAGTGKTYLFNTILAYARHLRKIALAMCTSGVGSLELSRGTTAHARCNIPLKCTSTSTCNISPKGQQAQLLRDADIILWDEISMVGRHTLDAVDRSLKDLMSRSQPDKPDLAFGGKLVIFAGDMRQVLPIVPHGGRAAIIQDLVKNSILFRENVVEEMHLTRNERVLRNDDTEETREFANFLLQVGNGDETLIERDLGDDIIRIPDKYVFDGSLPDLIKWVYPDIHTQSIDVTKKAVLTPKNKHVDIINDMAIKMMQGETISFFSTDSINENNPSASHFTTEYLNTISDAALPPHHLQLKIGCPLMLLRTISFKSGLCNGTRLKLLSIHNNRLLKVLILNGSHAGTTAVIPRIDITPSPDTDIPIPITRRQFPVRVAFAMTINKSQSQSLTHVGIYLPQPVFGHGQLYVSMSRSAIPTNTKILIENVPGRQGKFNQKPGTYTKNVVYQEALTLR
jgi:hypothetical protein